MYTKQDLRKFIEAKLGDYKFVLVSNRQPYIHIFVEDEIKWYQPASGLVVALDPVLRACGGTWVAHGSGSADKKVVDAKNRIQVPPDNPQYTLKRVWLSKDEEDGYYYGFSNEALWPLCHVAFTRPIFNLSDWQFYKKVNEKFADAVAEEIGKEKAIILVQDYHFALLPAMLKKRLPNAIIAQFWHIPWPNPEAFRLCPWKNEILEGLLGNDLFGLHIQYHCINFMDTVDRELEARVDREQQIIHYQQEKTLIRSYPISVDFERLSTEANTPEVEEEMKRLVRKYHLKDKVVAVGVDRIDYTKGIPERLRAIDRFLELYPQYREKFVYVELGAPSRVHIKAYKDLIEEIDSLTEEINWKYETDVWKPIVFIKEHCPLNTVYAFHRLANVCLVTSLHDGMNLVAKEFIACKAKDKKGALILSKFTGSARELTDAILINPYDIDAMARELRSAIEMPPNKQEERMTHMINAVAESNIYKWAMEMISDILKIR
jgi:trehalose 6-phosphate synthase